MTKTSKRPKIKFCGMTKEEDVLHALSLGVDAIGMILVPGSSRGISIEDARYLRSLIPKTVIAVAVVSSPETDWVQQIITEVVPDIIQFHGDESPSFCSQFNMPFWKAIAVKNKVSTEQLVRIFPKAQSILFDSWSPGGSGGHGVGFNWAYIPHEAKQLGQDFILSGGLFPNNLYRARALLEQGVVDMVDVSSGIEARGADQQKGVKSHLAMTEFMAEFQRLGDQTSPV